MRSTKGMSPIIATILLIAFAVSLGAMIMNWSSNLVSVGEQDSLCSSASVKVRAPVCYSGNSIKVDIINDGETEITGLVLKISSEVIDQNVQIKNSQNKPGEIIVKEIPIIRPENFQLDILAQVDAHGEIHACENSLHTTSELPVC